MSECCQSHLQRSPPFCPDVSLPSFISSSDPASWSAVVSWSRWDSLWPLRWEWRTLWGSCWWGMKISLLLHRPPPLLARHRHSAGQWQHWDENTKTFIFWLARNGIFSPLFTSSCKNWCFLRPATCLQGDQNTVMSTSLSGNARTVRFKSRNQVPGQIREGQILFFVMSSLAENNYLLFLFKRITKQSDFAFKKKTLT